jgi:hypothetical protein
MFWEQIAKTCMQISSKVPTPGRAAPQIIPEPGRSIPGAIPVGNSYNQSQTHPYIPPNSAKLIDSSLHFSCQQSLGAHEVRS